VIDSVSYDLNFWRYQPGVVLDHQEVYDRLCDGNVVDGLLELPAERMLARVVVEFSDWDRLDDLMFDGGDKGGFQLYITPQLLRVDCYGLHVDHMNKLIEIAHEFQCPLFDPQVGRRFDGT
jgi:hypothetical protein